MRFERDRKGIGAFGHALDHRRVDSVLYRKWLERGARHDGLADDHMLPRQHSALAVVADLGAMTSPSSGRNGGMNSLTLVRSLPSNRPLHHRSVLTEAQE